MVVLEGERPRPCVGGGLQVSLLPRRRQLLPPVAAVLAAVVVTLVVGGVWTPPCPLHTGTGRNSVGALGEGGPEITDSGRAVNVRGGSVSRPSLSSTPPNSTRSGSYSSDPSGSCLAPLKPRPTNSGSERPLGSGLVLMSITTPTLVRTGKTSRTATVS